MLLNKMEKPIMKGNMLQQRYGVQPDYGQGVNIAMLCILKHTNISNDYALFKAKYANSLPSGSNRYVMIKDVNTQTSMEHPSYALECSMNLQVLSLLAPSATIWVYECVDTTISSIKSVISKIIDDNQCKILTLSIGINESDIDEQDILEFEETFRHGVMDNGMVIVCSTSNDRNSIQWPATSQYVITVGGTTVSGRADLNGNINYIDRPLYNSSVGQSSYIAVPECQLNMGYSMRYVPDLVEYADGHRLDVIHQNSSVYVEGTSISSNIVSALIAEAIHRRNDAQLADINGLTIKNALYFSKDVFIRLKDCGLGKPSKNFISYIVSV